MRCGVPHPDQPCGRDQAEEHARVTAIVRDALLDGARLGMGEAIKAIDDYALEVPVAKPFCDDMAAQLRRMVAGMGGQA